MAYTSLFLIFLHLAILTCHVLDHHHHQARAEPRADLVLKTCNNQNMTESDRNTYQRHYTNVLSGMETQMRKWKWSRSNTGEPPNQVYVLAVCMDDLSVDDCLSCFNHIKTLVPQCFPSTGARIYFDGCFIRADNYSFDYEVFGPQDTSRCSNVMEDNNRYADAAKQAIQNAVKNAPTYEGYAYEHEYIDGASVYAMAKCWGSIPSESCSACLQDAAVASAICLPAAEGRILNTGCVLRYSNQQFSNSAFTNTVQGVVMYAIYVISAVSIGAVAIILGLCLGKLTYDSRIKNVLDEGIELKMGMNMLQFKYSTLEKATESFSEARKLGSGGSAEVFRGTLIDGREIAIKRLFIRGKTKVEEIQNEMDIISKAQHRNLLRFIGCCFTDGNCFLVYEYLVNNSLDFVLFDEERKKVLDWEKRLGIIVGTAEGLKYLHSDCEVHIVHRDIKASNILLDIKYRPKIADFGLARLSSHDKASHNTIAGTLGYMAPEYIAHGRLSEKVDVYSFGVLVLEIVSGVRNNAFQPEDQSLETLVTAAWKRFQADRVWDIIDESLGVEEDKEEIKRMVHVGLLCTQESPSSRPSMSTVVKMVREKDYDLPEPTKPPFTDESMELTFQFSSSRDQLPSDSCCEHDDHQKSDNGWPR